MTKIRKGRTQYWSFKIPRAGSSYKGGAFPLYSREYLRKHGKKLFEILMNKVPAEVYAEVVRNIRTSENI